MNSKINVCATCLSSDRCLFPLNKMALFIQELKFLKIQLTDSQICWECRNIIKKFHAFRNQVNAAKETLNNVTNMENVKSLSNLVTSFRIVSCNEYRCNTDPLNNDNTEYKENFLIIKECDDVNGITDKIGVDNKINDSVISSNNIDNDYKCDSNFNGNDENGIDDEIYEQKPDIDVINHYIENNADSEQIETIQNGATDKDLAKVNIVAETDTGNDTEKYIQVTWTTEEVERDRDKKRNHPNFKKIPFKCDSCVLGFTSKETLDVHMKKKHDENIGPDICHICQVRFPTLLSAERHIHKHFVFFKCLMCDYKSSELWAVVKHCKTKHQGDSPDSIHCKKCNDVFKSPKELEDHVQLKHAVVCDYCGDKFRGSDTLRQHRATVHSANRQYLCDVCTKTFKTKMRLETHLTRQHSSTDKKIMHCNICNVQFKNIITYRSHFRTSVMHSERAHKCLKCDKWFTSKSLMRRHYEFYHLKTSKYHCDSCDKLFLSAWLLKDHKRKYHGLDRIRKHPCSVCNKKFYDMSMLRRHMMIHSEQRTYMCEDCGDTFKQQPALYNHARLVHAAKRPSVKKNRK